MSIVGILVLIVFFILLIVLENNLFIGRVHTFSDQNPDEDNPPIND